MKCSFFRVAGARAIILAAAVVGISAAVAQIVELPEAPGKELVLGACIDCHGADTIVKAQRTPDEWTAVVERMIGYGAALSSEQQAAVLGYLNTHVGGAAGPAAAPVSAPSADPAAPEPTNENGTSNQ